MPLETQGSDPGFAGAKPPQQRLLSLDALRGFDMFWIIGADELVDALYRTWPIAPLRLLKQQMTHKSWDGMAFYDLIFPLFVFIVGVSLVFSLSRSIERSGRVASIKRILFRSLLLYTLGVLVYGGITRGVDHIRWMGVLQRIAICYLFASLLFCAFRLRMLIAICVALLAGYWALATFVPIRDFNLQNQQLEIRELNPGSPETRALFLATTNYVRGRFEDGLNLPQQLDFRYLPGFKWDYAYDPEGLLSTLPAIATCLLGVFAGLLLKSSAWSDQKKVFGLVIGGAILLALGFLWSFQFPVIKKIWTSSYVLVAGGYSCLLLGLFYQIIEIWRWRAWCAPFVWIGMNAITIYLVSEVLGPGDLAQRIIGGPVQKSLGAWGDLVLVLVLLGMMLALVRFLYQRKIFLRL